MSRQASGLPNQTELHFGRLLIRPYALSATPIEPLVGVALVVLLGIVFAAEFVTPDDVIAAVALIPLLGAVWLLSDGWALLIAILLLAFFAVAAVFEPTNRLTLAVVAIVSILTASVVRIYAVRVAGMLSSHRHLRPVVSIQAMPAAFGKIDGVSHGIRALTRRELEVARYGAEGYTAPEIARQLHIGKRTVESHMSGIYAKLRISSRAELIRMAGSLADRT
jgi:DNA-binding CsgD family transcriptional regulator